METITRKRSFGNTKFCNADGTVIVTFSGYGSAMEGLMIDALARNGRYRLIEEGGLVLIGTLDEIINPAPDSIASGRASIVSFDA